jgi:hypothetical protein
MASRRLLVAATTGDAIADQDIRTVEVPSIVRLAASCVTLTDNVGLRLDKTIIMDDGIVNIRAAALSLVDAEADVVVRETVVGPGTLRIPVTVTTSAIIHLEVEPIL